MPSARPRCPPLAAALLVLGEAQTLPSQVAYATSLLESPGVLWPLERVSAQASADAAVTHRGEPRGVVYNARLEAGLDAVSLVLLALELDVTAKRTVEIGGLRLQLLSAQLLLLRRESKPDDRRPPSTAGTRRRVISDRWRAWAQEVAGLLTEIYAVEAARSQLELQFLAGHPTLFPDTAKASEELRAKAEHLADVGLAVVELGSHRTLTRQLTAALRLDALRADGLAQAPGRAAEVLAFVRVEALQLTGDLHAARAVAWKSIYE